MTVKMTLAAIKFYKDEGAKQQVSEGFVRRFQSLGKSLKNVKSLGLNAQLNASQKQRFADRYHKFSF